MQGYPPPPPFAAPVARDRWEYRIVTFDKGLGFKTALADQHAAHLNALGADGWELVSLTANAGAGTFGASTSHSLVFKRRLP